MISKTIPALLGACALACSGSGFEDGSGDSADEGGAGPASGDFYVFAPYAEDACGLNKVWLALSILEPLKFDVGKDGSSFAWDDVHGVRADCRSTGKGQFQCAIPPVTSVEGSAGKIEITQTITGSWTSPDRFEGRFEHKLSCNGASCADVAQDVPSGLPCQSSGPWFAYRAMPESFVPETGEYAATVEPLITTCDQAPSVPRDQTLRIEAKDDGTAQVFPDGSDIAHQCKFEGRGRTSCSRTATIDSLEASSVVEAMWTSATSFEGGAVLASRCPAGGDCAATALGELPCVSVYRLSAKAAGAASY